MHFFPGGNSFEDFALLGSADLLPKTPMKRRDTEIYRVAGNGVIGNRVIFDMQSCLPKHEPHRLLKSPEPCLSMGSDVLIIARDPIAHVYSDEVLKRAGFLVQSMTPWEAKNMFSQNLPAYSLVIFSSTIYPRETVEIGKQLRRRSPASKLLLILGPDAVPGNLSIFDSVIEGLDGPAALIREARRLTTVSKWQIMPAIKPIPPN